MDLNHERTWSGTSFHWPLSKAAAPVEISAPRAKASVAAGRVTIIVSASEKSPFQNATNLESVPLRRCKRLAIWADTSGNLPTVCRLAVVGYAVGDRRQHSLGAIISLRMSGPCARVLRISCPRSNQFA